MLSRLSFAASRFICLFPLPDGPLHYLTWLPYGVVWRGDSICQYRVLWCYGRVKDELSGLTVLLFGGLNNNRKMKCQYISSGCLQGRIQ